MAQAKWKRYYGVVLDHKSLNRTFVNGLMYGSREEAHEAAKGIMLMFNASGLKVRPIGVVGVKSLRKGRVQEALHARTIPVERKPDGQGVS